MTSPTIIQAMTDDDALGPWFAGDSWHAWRVVLKAAFALPMDDDDLSIFEELSGGRTPPSNRVRELWIVVGRRGGKDSIVSGIATFAAAIEEAHIGRLRPGEMATVACLASDRDQAQIILRYIKAMFAEHPDLSSKVLRDTQSGIELDNAAEIVVTTNNFRTARGRSLLLAILDECAFYRDENTANPDKETYRSLVPSLATLAPESMIVGISSPYKKSGLLYEKYSKHFGKNDDRILVIQAPSIRMNPTLDPGDIEAALDEDPEAARAEWLAEFRSDISDFISRELVEAAVDSDVVVRPRVPGMRYVAFADVAGGTGKDSFTGAVAHVDGNDIILDAVMEIRPPFNPSVATEQMSDLFKSFGISTVTADKYAIGFVTDAFKKHGITYQSSERDRSQIYIECLPLFTAGRVRLLDNKRIITQFASLERKVVASGRDRVDHPRDGHDDLSNAVAGVLVELRSKKAPMIISDEALRRASSSSFSNFRTGRTA